MIDRGKKKQTTNNNKHNRIRVIKFNSVADLLIKLQVFVTARVKFEKND